MLTIYDPTYPNFKLLWSEIETIHNKRSNEVKNSALYNAESQMLLFSSDMEIDISNRCFCPIVTVT